MGTFIKYVIYLLILVALFIVIRGCYYGTINSSTTIGSVANQVSEGTQNLAHEAAGVVNDTVDKIAATNDATTAAGVERGRNPAVGTR